MITDKIRDLMGLNKLPIDQREKIEAVMTDAALNRKYNRNYAVKQQIGEICEMLGARRLDEDVQKDLSEKIELIINHLAGRENIEKIPVDFWKWNSDASSVKPAPGKIDKKLFEWEKPNKPHTGKKASVNEYKWGSGDLAHSVMEASDGSGAGSTELHTNWERHQKKVYIDKAYNVLTSTDGVVSIGTKLSEIDVLNLRRKGYCVLFGESKNPNKF